MTGVTVAPASSRAEAMEAFELACRVFSEHAAIPDYGVFKAMLWHEDPTYAPENLLLARLPSGVLAGALRIVPRALCRGDQTLSVAGLSSVCVDAAHRGKGYSATLMASAIEHCTSRRFDLALLFARRAADHYYTRFGFWGISSYNTASLRLERGAHGKRSGILTVTPADRKLLDVYTEAYALSYAGAFGRFVRDPRYWAFILERTGRVPGMRWLTLRADGAPVGYAVCSDDVVHEIAWLPDLDLQTLASAVASALPAAHQHGSLVMEVPPEHRVFHAAAGCDVTLATRECSYGGHMVRILLTRRVKALLEERLANRLTSLGAGAHESTFEGLGVYYDGARCRVELDAASGQTMSYARTARLLGAQSLSLPGWNLDCAKPFNVSYPDQL